MDQKRADLLVDAVLSGLPVDGTADDAGPAAGDPSGGLGRHVARTWMTSPRT